MINSKTLLEETGISRATLNNYIAAGLLPRPEVIRPSTEESDAPRIGVFPDTAVDRVRDIQRLKGEGYSLEEISAQLGATATPKPGNSPEETPPSMPADAGKPGLAQSAPGKGKFLELSLPDLPYPAYMVNYNFELAWCNDAAATLFLGGREALPANAEQRNILCFLLRGAGCADERGCDEILRFHIGLVRERLSREQLAGLCHGLSFAQMKRLDALYEEAPSLPHHGIVQQTLFLPTGKDGAAEARPAYATFFREGILIVYPPPESDENGLVALLARRDIVIRDLLRRRLPVLTPLAVLVADLQSSVRICSELPPEEYFELINEIRTTLEPIFRKYYGTYGKHAGDGILYYFFPQPDCNYLFNAIQCAVEIREAMRRISKAWQLHKGWLNELHLNIGIHEGQEWLGTFQTSTSVEITVLGDTINHAARLSDFSRQGSIFASKSLLAKLDSGIRERVRYGIRRQDAAGREVVVKSSFSSVANLVNLDDMHNSKCRDIAALPVAEIFEVDGKA